MNKIIVFSLIVLGVFFGYKYFPSKPIIETSSNILPVAPGLIADKLQIPWSLVFLPDKSILFTERPGRLRMITASGSLVDAPIEAIKDVKQIGEGGLLGIEVHPNFKKNRYIYLYYTYSGDQSQTLNKVVRYEFDGTRLSAPKTIVSGIPGNANHNGGRLKFGPDGYLYITTGDSQNPSLSQNKNSLAGKILRTTDDGKAAPGNPFGNLTYSYGHRNPQGLAWDETGRLWSTEHGSSAGDEVNLIESGLNYGWPEIRKDETRPGMVVSVYHSGNDTWAPSGAAYIRPYLYFAGLRSNTLFKYNTQTKKLDQLLRGKYGRIRDVVLGPDDLLYITTSNMDGRSLTHLDGDKIIRLDPNNL